MSKYRISARMLVSLAAVFSIVTQRSTPGGGALRDDTKNGCEGDYPHARHIISLATLQTRRNN